MIEESTGAVLEMELRNRILQLSRLTDAQASTITRAIDTNTELLNYIDRLEDRLATVTANLQSSEQQCRELQDALTVVKQENAAIDKFFVVGEVVGSANLLSSNMFLHTFRAFADAKRFRNGAKVYVELSDEVKP